MQTVHGNKSKFIKREIKGADKVAKLYHAIGRPGYKMFYNTLQKGLIHNCTTTVQHAKNAFHIYRPDKVALMWIDILFFDTIPFIITISRDINFYTVEKLTDRENSTILECLIKVMSIYNSRGFYVQYILADGEV